MTITYTLLIIKWKDLFSFCFDIRSSLASCCISVNYHHKFCLPLIAICCCFEAFFAIQCLEISFRVKTSLEINLHTCRFDIEDLHRHGDIKGYFPKSLNVQILAICILMTWKLNFDVLDLNFSVVGLDFCYILRLQLSQPLFFLSISMIN